MSAQSISIDALLQQQGHFTFMVGGDSVSAEADAAIRAGLERVLPLHGLVVRSLHGGRSQKYVVSHEADVDQASLFQPLKDLARSLNLAYAIFPNLAAPPVFKLAVMDMDSTLINQEVIEELAEFAGVREHVTKVTTLAMEGKLDFHQALRERVKLLAGQPASILHEVYESRISASGGLKELIAGFKAQGIVTAVVSGGFAPVVEPFAKREGLDHALANQLEIVDGKLTGNVLGEIVDATVKRRTLLELCEKLRCPSTEAIAIGDGANDLQMMGVAGLGIAFCAKPIVQEEALAAINRRRLDDALLFLE